MKLRTLLALAIAAAGCDGGEGFPDARNGDGALPTGTFSMSWTLTDTATAMPVSCDDAGATILSLTIREEGAGNAMVDVFMCSSLQATSRPIPIGTYVLGFEMKGPGGLIATAPGRSDVVITANQDTPIGVVDFGLIATGGLSFRITAGTTMTNCGLIVDMGGGIDTMALTMTKGGTCVPVDWTVGAGTYSATCPTPGTTACIENTVDIVATGLDSGRYQLSAVGNIAAAACWTGAREVRVPTGDASAMSTLSMAYQPAVVGCPMLP